jgi:hypothetical protein
MKPKDTEAGSSQMNCKSYNLPQKSTKLQDYYMYTVTFKKIKCLLSNSKHFKTTLKVLLLSHTFHYADEFILLISCLTVCLAVKFIPVVAYVGYSQE